MRETSLLLTRSDGIFVKTKLPLKSLSIKKDFKQVPEVCEFSHLHFLTVGIDTNLNVGVPSPRPFHMGLCYRYRFLKPSLYYPLQHFQLSFQCLTNFGTNYSLYLLGLSCSMNYLLFIVISVPLWCQKSSWVKIFTMCWSKCYACGLRIELTNVFLLLTIYLATLGCPRSHILMAVYIHFDLSSIGVQAVYSALHSFILFFLYFGYHECPVIWKMLVVDHHLHLWAHVSDALISWIWCYRMACWIV